VNKLIVVLACIAMILTSQVRAQDSASGEKILIGQWAVKIGNWQDTWTFKADGAVSSTKQPKLKGTWKKETNCILIQWDEVEKGCNTWEAFTLPLKKEGTQGGNWNGSKVTANKVE